ncbi:homeobox-DDT domain protein RLT1-like isoform X1 [Senna tora]|uniref:Homeobox-DDT domain protein RLT1-like isoform X1 n=1 Tax=Senna tora TaxID=362788 RepID=A0A834WVR7_9FABA|nr:homeobox-DDT domain protein RLT1-like isoform X1 [Senna tora]
MLSCMLTKLDNEKKIQGIRFANRGLTISHLMYADDTIMFFKATPEACNHVNQALNIYSRLAGQRINKDKKRLFPSKENGGLGLRETDKVNKALIAKQTWRIIEHPNSLYSRWTSSKYFKRSIRFIETLIADTGNDKLLVLAMVVLNNIWEARNKLYMEGKRKKIESIVQTIRMQWQEYTSLHSGNARLDLVALIGILMLRFGTSRNVSLAPSRAFGGNGSRFYHEKQVNNNFPLVLLLDHLRRGGDSPGFMTLMEVGENESLNCAMKASKSEILCLHWPTGSLQSQSHSSLDGFKSMEANHELQWRMEESSELQLEENKVSMEKNKKRRLKTPTQVMALENFYDEHKYPTEEMKLELAEELGLTEKQVSGWFCHRRLKDKRLLKDETCANGRQDRSSGGIQEHGSGLGQDSCGSTKHGEYRHLDPKEVESHGLYGHDFSAADMTYEHRSHYTENVSGMDTSSESSSSLQDQFSQGQDPYNLEPSRYLTPNRGLPPLNPKTAINMGYKPSGYLKVKGEIENAAITAVKKQLGKHYQEEGPLLGVEFDPVPPGAFECQNGYPVHDYCESYLCNLMNSLAESLHVANPTVPSPPEVSAVKRQPSLSSRHDSKYSSQDSHMEVADLGSLHDTDFQDKKSRQHTKNKHTFHSHFPGRNSSLDLYEDSIREASAYNSNKNHTMGTKHEGMRSDSASNHSDHFEGDLTVKQTEQLLHCYDYDNAKNVKRSGHVKSKPSNSFRNARISVDTEETGVSPRIAKEEKFNGDKKARKKYYDSERMRVLPNETMIAKRLKDDLPKKHSVKHTPIAELQPRKNQRSAAEVPSSFSEDDETADTSTSLD